MSSSGLATPRPLGLRGGGRDKVRTQQHERSWLYARRGTIPTLSSCPATATFARCSLLTRRWEWHSDLHVSTPTSRRSAAFPSSTQAQARQRSWLFSNSEPLCASESVTRPALGL